MLSSNINGQSGVACSGCFMGAHPSRAKPVLIKPPQVHVATQSALRGVLGLSDSTRSALAAGGFLLAALGLGAAIWSSQRASKRPQRKRQALLYRGHGRQRYMTIP